MRLFTCTFIFASVLVLSSGQMQSAYEWRFIDYVWPSKAERTKAVLSGLYNPNIVIPMDVDRDKAGRVFLTFLGNQGTPATLGVVSDSVGPSGPLILPYPNWSWFNSGNCDSLLNIYRIAIDECNRLWVLDTGFKEILGQQIKCQAKLVVFDLNTDRWLMTYNIDDNLARGRNGQTLLATPVVDTEGPSCEKTTVYIADVFGYGLVVLNDERSFRVEHATFAADPSATYFQTGNDTIEFEAGGILGLAISPRLFPNEYKYLYYRPLSSFDLFAVRTDALQRFAKGQPISYRENKNIFPSQPVVMAFSSQGTLFYGLTREIAIGCWNKYSKPSKENLVIVSQDAEKLQYLNGLKVIKPSSAHPDEELWVLSNRFLGYLSGKLNRQDVNYRVLRGSVKSLIKDTKCDLPPGINGMAMFSFRLRSNKKNTVTMIC